jgi:aspartyl/glutamyl-tRNA(Asn/Gln) amidotransferase C subunit
MAIGKDIVKIASLARMELTEAERERLGTEFEKITAYFADLQKLQLEGEMTLGYRCPRVEDTPRDYDIKIEELTEHLKDGQFHIPPWLA